MREWPPLSEPELLARLALDDDAFFALARKMFEAWGRRDYEPELLERALGYPWERPAGSYVMRNGEVDVLTDLDPAHRAAIIDDYTRDRHPVLAFGGNGSPSYLTIKFDHFEDQEDKDLLVLCGHLHDADVGAAASLSPIGCMAGTLFASPGTEVRAAMVWCTTNQITQLTWSEVPYRFARLDDATFAMDESDVEVEQVFAYVSRFGAYCVDGKPIALAAVPAKERTATPFTQRELLDLVAPDLIGPDARAEDVVRTIFEDRAAIMEQVAETLWPNSEQLKLPWTPFPSADPPITR